MAHRTVSSDHDPAADAGHDALAEAIATKLRKGYWVESQSETEARLVALGRKRWFGLFGGRVPETREIVRVDPEGRVSVEQLPERRY